MMRVAIMQPYLFPYIGYFQLIHAVDKFVLLDDVNFINKGWINRNNILLNGKAYLFTVPLENASQNRLIRDISISADAKWANKFLSTLSQSYKKAPYFEPAYAMVEDIVNSNENNVSKKICYSLRKINDYVGIKTPIVETSSVYPGGDLKAQEKIIFICKQEKATDYINPIGGLELYEKKRFEQDGIKLYFLKTGEIKYKQSSNEFVPYLSIIDVLMFNSKEQITELLNRFTLVTNE